MTRAELMEIGAIIGPLSVAISYLTSEQRTKLFLALLTQEVCKLPPGARDHELALIIADLPGIFCATEKGMRIVLVENAREGA